MFNSEADKLSMLAPERRQNDRRKGNSTSTCEIKENAVVTVKSSNNLLTPLVGYLAALTFLIPYLMGLVLAKGFLQTLYAFFPFYSYYLVVEKFMQMYGII